MGHSDIDIQFGTDVMTSYIVPNSVWPKYVRGYASHHAHGMSVYYYQHQTRRLYPCTFVRRTRHGKILINTSGRIDQTPEEAPQRFNHREGKRFRHTVSAIVWPNGLEAIVELQTQR